MSSDHRERQRQQQEQRRAAQQERHREQQERQRELQRGVAGFTGFLEGTEGTEGTEGKRERNERQLESWQQGFEQKIAATQERLQAIHDRFHGAPARGAARDHLIEVASVLFQARGFADVSMQQIADAVGVTKAALYYHFRSKEDLYEVVVQEAINQFWTAIIDRVKAVGPLRETLRGIVEYTTAMMGEFSTRLMEDARHHLTPEALWRILAEHPTPERELQDLFRRAIAAGEMRPLNVEVVAEMFLAMAMSLGEQGHAPRTIQPGDIDLLIDILLHGIAATSDE